MHAGTDANPYIQAIMNGNQRNPDRNEITSIYDDEETKVSLEVSH